MGWATCGWNDEWKVWMGYAEDGEYINEKL